MAWLAGLGGAVVAGFWWLRADAGHAPAQPVSFSHALHAGELEIDCRYCHGGAETSPVAGIPATTVCMNCHATIGKENPLLDPVRESAQSREPIRWARVHRLGDDVAFHHGAHVRAGIGCASCHGRVDEMEVVRQEEPYTRTWCLDCHHDPAPHLRAPHEVTKMRWIAPPDQVERGRLRIRENRLDPATDCSGCHQ